MSNPVFVSKARLRLAAYLAVVATLLLVVYVIQLQDTNAYYGWRPYVGSFGQILTTLVMMFITLCVVPHQISRPSDFFLLFHGVVVLLSCALFNQVTGTIDVVQALALFLTLLSPVIAVLALRRIALRVPPVLRMQPVLVHGLAVALIGLAFAYGYSKGGGGGFDWITMYDRRLEGREEFEARSAGAYLLSMAINGLTPFVAFVGGARRNVTLMALGVGMGCFAFWLLGLKAPFAMALLFAVVGHLLNSGRIHKVPRFIAVGILFICLLAIAEFLAFDRSLIAEVVVRRAFVIQGAVQSYYWDVIGRGFAGGFESFLIGPSVSAPEGIAFFVGSEYLGDPEANVNTNAFLVALAEHGLFGYVGSILFVSVYLSAMDALYRTSARLEVFFVVSLYSLLLTEQSYTVAFVSSGIGLLTVLVFLIGKGRSRAAPDSRLPDHAWKSSGTVEKPV